MAMPLSPIPTADPMVDRPTLRMLANWYRWFSELTERMTNTSTSLGRTSQTGLSGSVTPTVLFTPSIRGLYRVSWALQLTRAATTSSSVTVTIGWTSGGVSQSQTFPAVTGNTTTTGASGVVLMLPDPSTGVTIQTAYSSSGATTMQYALSASVELVP